MDKCQQNLQCFTNKLHVFHKICWVFDGVPIYFPHFPMGFSDFSKPKSYSKSSTWRCSFLFIRRSRRIQQKPQQLRHGIDVEELREELLTVPRGQGITEEAKELLQGMDGRGVFDVFQSYSIINSC